MSIKQDPNTKKWIVSCSKRHPITRKPRSYRRININSKAEAKRVERELIVKLHDSLKEEASIKWWDLVEDYLKYCAEQSIFEKTIFNRRVCLKAYTFEVWGHRDIMSISSFEIRDLILTKVGHKSPSYQKNIYKFIRLAFNYAVEIGKLTSSPVPRMTFKIQNKLKSVLTEKQAKELLKVAKEVDCEWYPHWALALYTGMRNGELFALTWDKVNLDERIIKVDTSWNNKDGFKSTKSGEDRLIQVSNDLLPLLEGLKRQNEGFFVLPRLAQWETGDQARHLRMFLQGMGLPRIRFHDLRATWATILLNRGIAPIKVMKMGGWKEIKTMQHYIRLAGVDIKGITDNLSLI